MSPEYGPEYSVPHSAYSGVPHPPQQSSTPGPIAMTGANLHSLLDEIDGELAGLYESLSFLDDRTHPVRRSEASKLTDDPTTSALSSPLSVRLRAISTAVTDSRNRVQAITSTLEI